MWIQESHVTPLTFDAVAPWQSQVHARTFWHARPDRPCFREPPLVLLHRRLCSSAFGSSAFSAPRRRRPALPRLSCAWTLQSSRWSPASARLLPSPSASRAPYRSPARRHLRRSRRVPSPPRSQEPLSPRPARRTRSAICVGPDAGPQSLQRLVTPALRLSLRILLASCSAQQSELPLVDPPLLPQLRSLLR